MLKSNFPNGMVPNGSYNEEVLLGLSKPIRKQGLNRPCPICGAWNYVAFSKNRKLKESWVECYDCHVAYGL